MKRRALLAGAAGLAVARPAAAAPPLAARPIDRLAEAWWRARHAAKLAELRAGAVDLIFLGDSITENFEKSGPPAWQDFSPVWRHFYGDRHAVNLGFRGDATCHLLWRLRNGEIDGIAPRAAVILICANNLGRLHWPAADDLAGIDAVVAETQRRLPQTQILLLGILPSDRTAWATRTTGEINTALAARYGSGRVAGVTFHDATALFLRNGRLDRTLFYDPLLTPPDPPLHPTAAMQARLCAAIEPTLAAMLGDRAHAGYPD
jgi:lysophospholipase L1-like esterase